MSARAAGDVRREQRSAAAARQRQRRPRHGEGGGGGGGSGAGPAATAAAMAAVGERRSLPSPEAMLGQPWSHWVDAAKLHGNDGERPSPPRAQPPLPAGSPLPAGLRVPRARPRRGRDRGAPIRHGRVPGWRAPWVPGPGRRLGPFLRPRPPPPAPNVAAEFVVRCAVPGAAAPPGQGLGSSAERTALAPVPVIRDTGREDLSPFPEADSSCPRFSLGWGSSHAR